MISALLRAYRLSLARDRVAQIMTFVLPVAFFSIFALVFGRQGMDEVEPVRVALVDEDRSPDSRAFAAALEAEAGLRVRDSVRAPGRGGVRVPIDRARARELVRDGEVPIALVIPAGRGESFPDLIRGSAPVDVLTDPSDPVARQIVTGLAQRAAARVLRRGLAAAFGGPAGADTASPATGGPDPLALVSTRVTEVAGERNAAGARMVSFYAAGIAVMFLLFSCAAAGGALLEEQESGTLERVLGTRVGMTGLLAGKWLFVTLLGVVQVTVMFVWGALVFGLDLLGHLPGFAVMTLATAAAAAGFGLVLATLCRTRQQLGGIATLVILVMSALGGSMFPRFLMSPEMQRVGLATFNAWALDGYVLVFWRDAALADLAPQLGVLGALTVAFLGGARLLARRWERA